MQPPGPQDCWPLTANAAPWLHKAADRWLLMQPPTHPRHRAAADLSLLMQPPGLHRDADPGLSAQPLELHMGAQCLLSKHLTKPIALFHNSLNYLLSPLQECCAHNVCLGESVCLRQREVGTMPCIKQTVKSATVSKGIHSKQWHLYWA